MQRRLWAAVALTLILASTAFAAYWSIPRTPLSRDANDVDHVTLYQNGLAAITLVRPFEGVGGDQVLEISLPTTTIFDSLIVVGEGVIVRELRSSLAADPALHPGDKLTVRLDDGSTVQGVFQASQGNQLLLSKEGGTVLVQLSKVSAVEVTGRTVDPSGPGSTSVSVLVRAELGPRTVRISYLAQGTGWAPNYILDPQTGDMTFFATLTGLQDWSNVTLDLVAGNPNMVYTPNYAKTQLHFSEAAGAPAMDSDGGYGGGFSGSQALGAMHRYHYGGTVDLALGETVRLPVVTGKAEILRHYFRADGNPYAGEWTGLPETYQLRNTLGETLPAGPVRVYLDGEWIGADTLPALGKGEQGNITVSFSDDVKARTVQLEQTRSDPVSSGFGGRRIVHVTTTYDLQVRNLGAEAVDLRATFHTNEGSTTKVLEVTPAPDEERPANRVWDDSLDPGETLHFVLTIETQEETYI